MTDEEKIKELEATVRGYRAGMIAMVNHNRDAFCPFCERTTMVSYTKLQARPHLLEEFNKDLTWEEVEELSKKAQAQGPSLVTLN